MQTVIAVAMHKPSAVPDAPPYLPVQAGAAVHASIGVQRDDEGENISGRNPLYCELTAHYWLWKNAAAEAYGLCHYRRYFTRHPRSGNSLSQPKADSSLGEGALAGLLTQEEIDALLETADVIVPRPRLYLIETNWSHYAHAHRESDLQQLRAVIGDTCPDDLPAFDQVMKRRWGRRFNMFIMRREWFEAYSAWLFGVLFALETRLGGDIPPRTMGFIAERLMDVWLERTRPRVKQLPVLHTEGQNWPEKIAGFLRRKFTSVKAPSQV